MKKRILSMLLVIVMVLSLVPVTALAAPGLKITSNGEMQYTLEKDKDLILALTGANEGDTIVWTSGNTGVAVVQPNTDDKTTCVVQGVGEGKLNITATVTPENGTAQTVTYPLGVYNVVAEKPVIDGGDFSVTLGGTAKTMTYTKPAGTFGVELTRWKSSNPNVATIGLTSGELNVKATGTTEISVFFNGQWSDPVTCTVVEKLTAEIVGSSPMVVGREQELSLVFNTDHDLPETIYWRTSPSDSDLVTLTKVSGNEYKCKVKAEKDGEVVVVAAWGTPEETDKKAKLTLTINKPEQFTIMRGEKVVETSKGLALKGKETAELTAVVDNGEDLSKIEWNIVANGDGAIETQIVGNKITVTGANPGTATISAYIQGDKENTEVTIQITVEPKATIANKPADGSKKTLYVNDTFTCDLEAELVNADDLTLVSSQPDAVEIKDNAITAKKAATDVKISLKKGETEFDSFLLDILGQARIEIDPEMPREMLTGDKLDLKAVVKDASGAVVEGKTVNWKYLDNIDANMTILGSSTLTANPNPTIPFDVELQAYLNDEVLGNLEADVTISVTPRTASVALMKGTENISNKSTILSVKDTAGITIQAVIMPENARQVVSWEVTPRDICEFTPHDDSIEIKPVSAQKTGTVTVIATAADGTGVRCETKVELVKTADTIQITNAPAQMRGGANLQLRTNLDDDKTLTDRRVVWSVPKEFEQLASVTADGFLDTAAVTQPTPIKVEVTLVANGAKGEANITLYPAVTNIKIVCKDGTKLENVLPYTSAPIALDMEVTPSKDYGSFVWTSSNEKVATVDPATGVMELKDAGNVRISCTAYDTDPETALKIARGEIRDDTKVMATGYKSLEIVKKATDVVIDANGVTELVSGKNAVFTATVYADLATGLKAGNQKVTWHVEDEYGNPTKAATINSRGRLYAKTVNYGTNVVVYATSVEDNEVFDCHTVLIQPKKERTFAAFLEDDDGIEGDGRIIESTLYMNAGETATISGKWYIRGEGFSYEEDCLFFSSNRSVATIDQNDGTVETLKNGSTTITVRATDPDTRNVYTAKFTLHVVNTVDHIVISKPNNTPNYVRSGSYMNLSATVWSNVIETIKADNQGVTWGVYEYAEDETSVVPPVGSPEVPSEAEKAGGVEVDPSLLIATKAAYMTSGGTLVANSVRENKTVVVVAASKENPSSIAVFEMEIRPAKAYTVTAGYEDDEGEFVIPTGAVNMEVVYKGDAVELSPDITAKVYASDRSPAGYKEDPKIVWETSNKDIVKIVKGQLTYTGKTGKVKVTPTFKAGNTTYRGNTLTLNIIKPVEEIKVTKKYANQELYSGKSLLMYAIVDENATTRRVTWSLVGDGDEAFASINPTTGLIRAKKGLTSRKEITVRATAVDGSGEYDEMGVIIYPLATKVMITSTFTTIKVNEEGKVVSAQVFPNVLEGGVQIGANQDVKWSSSRSSVLAVDEGGNLTAKRRGTATIKAKATDGSGKYATIKITVVNP